MIEVLEVHFGTGEPDYVLLQVMGRERPDSDDYWDGNWLKAVFSVRVRGFSGSARGAIRTEELVTFSRQLKSLGASLAGEALFATMEEWCEIRVVATNRLGSIGLAGYLLDSPNRLQFGFELDQTYLSFPLKQLESIAQRYPVVGKPPTR